MLQTKVPEKNETFYSQYPFILGPVGFEVIKQTGANALELLHYAYIF
jgi:hypothetical protein